MSQEIINVMDYICDKLGIAIDWTAENVWPQVMEILSRYRLYEIVNSSAKIVLDIVIIIGICIIISKMIHAYYNSKNERESNFFWDYTTYTYHHDSMCISFAAIFIVSICFVLGIVSIVTIFTNIDNLMKWIFIPEIQILELLQGYVR